MITTMCPAGPLTPDIVDLFPLCSCLCTADNHVVCAEPQQGEECVPLRLEGHFVPQAETTQAPAAGEQQGSWRQACRGSSKCVTACGQRCCSFRMEVPAVLLSEPSAPGSSQQDRWAGLWPFSYTRVRAPVSVVVTAALAACQMPACGSVHVKLHRLSGVITGPGGRPLDSNLGAALSSLLLQLDAQLGEDDCQLDVDLGGEDPEVRIVNTARVHLDRSECDMLHTALPFLITACKTSGRCT